MTDAAACALTVLRSIDERRPMTKAFVEATNGTVTRRDYGKATWFSVETVPVAGIRDIHARLVELEADPSACVIRGEPKAGVDRGRLRRVKLGAEATFDETPRRWFMLDADGIVLPPGVSVLADPADAARALLDILAAHAPDLMDVTAVVQFSSSAGLDEWAATDARWAGVAKKGVAAHVWVCLRVPRGEAELKRWVAALKVASGLRLDVATVHTVQPHYTAAPIFEAPLRDPLAGRRTVLVEGLEDAADLVIPAARARAERYDAEGGGGAREGKGFAAYLDEIGDPVAGFHQPIVRAVCSFVATNWPHPDAAVLKGAIRERIRRADPGGRSDADIERYASDRFLDALITWATAREEEKQAERKAQAASAPPVDPTFPDKGVSLEEARRLADAAIADFADRVRAGKGLEVMLRMTVGGGKSEAAVRGEEALLAAGREQLLRAEAKDAGKSAVFYLVPRHNLGDELRERIAKAHPALAVAVWRGMDADDPAAPGKKMCRDPALPRAAAAAGLGVSEACPACPLRGECGYNAQRQQRGDIWLAAHQLAFQGKPAGLPPCAALVVDEAFWPAGVGGVDGHPMQLALSALEDRRIGGLRGTAADRLLNLRGLVRDVLAGHPEGGLLREEFERVGFTAKSADEWHDLEWRLKPDPKLHDDMARDEVLDRLRDARTQGFTPLRPQLARHVRELLEGDAARSVNATLMRDVDLGRNQGAGDVVQFEWRKDFAKWAQPAPKLFLDATTHPDVLRPWAPKLEVVDIEVEAKGQRVRQVVGREFGRTFFAQNANNVARVADLVVVELAQAAGETLVIAQVAVEDGLRPELERRFSGRLPDRLHIAHHGAITGLDCYRDVDRLVVVGRPALNRINGERQAEIIKGGPVEVEPDGEEARWTMVNAGIRLADGTGRRVKQPRHQDPLVEALRWSISEGAVLQAIGRARGVQRTRPVHVTLLAEFALPLTVEEVVDWGEAQPERLTIAAGEAALAGRALPLAPADLAFVRPDLWATPGRRSWTWCGLKGLKCL